MHKPGLLKYVAALVLLSAGASSSDAAVYLVDLNDNSGSGGPGGSWNSFAAPSNISATTGTALFDFTGTTPASPVRLIRAGTINDNSGTPSTLFNPAQPGFENLPAWVAAGGNDDAAADYFFTSIAGVDTYTLTFSNLTAGDTVSLDILASRGTNQASGFYDYSLDGGTTWTGFRVLNGDGTVATTDGWDTNTTKSQAYSLNSQGFALHRYLNLDNVALTGSTLAVRVSDNPGVTDAFSGINAMRLTVVPEPTALGLLVAGSALLAAPRRQRR